jgi:hypothetical protein
MAKKGLSLIKSPLLAEGRFVAYSSRRSIAKTELAGLAQSFGYCDFAIGASGGGAPRRR